MRLPDEAEVLQQARRFFSNMLSGDARGAARLAAYPFHLEAEVLPSEEVLHRVLSQHLRVKRTDRLTLYGIEVLTVAEMKARHGAPPERLGFPLGGPRTFVAIANLSGRAAVALFQHRGGAFRVVAYHD